MSYTTSTVKPNEYVLDGETDLEREGPVVDLVSIKPDQAFAAWTELALKVSDDASPSTVYEECEKFLMQNKSVASFAHLVVWLYMIYRFTVGSTATIRKNRTSAIASFWRVCAFASTEFNQLAWYAAMKNKLTLMTVSWSGTWGLRKYEANELYSLNYPNKSCTDEVHAVVEPDWVFLPNGTSSNKIRNILQEYLNKSPEVSTFAPRYYMIPKASKKAHFVRSAQANILQIQKILICFLALSQLPGVEAWTGSPMRTTLWAAFGAVEFALQILIEAYSAVFALLTYLTFDVVGEYGGWVLTTFASDTTPVKDSIFFVDLKWVMWIMVILGAILYYKNLPYLKGFFASVAILCIWNTLAFNDYVDIRTFTISVASSWFTYIIYQLFLKAAEWFARTFCGKKNDPLVFHFILGNEAIKVRRFDDGTTDFVKTPHIIKEASGTSGSKLEETRPVPAWQGTVCNYQTSQCAQAVKVKQNDKYSLWVTVAHIYTPDFKERMRLSLNGLTNSATVTDYPILDTMVFLKLDLMFIVVNETNRPCAKFRDLRMGEISENGYLTSLDLFGVLTTRYGRVFKYNTDNCAILGYDLDTNGGDCGAAVQDSNGRVIGIHSRGCVENDGTIRNYGIASGTILKVCEMIFKPPTTKILKESTDGYQPMFYKWIDDYAAQTLGDGSVILSNFYPLPTVSNGEITWAIPGSRDVSWWHKLGLRVGDYVEMVKTAQLGLDPTNWADRNLLEKNPVQVANDIRNMESIIDQWLKSKSDPSKRLGLMKKLDQTQLPDGKKIPMPIGVKYVYSRDGRPIDTKEVIDMNLTESELEKKGIMKYAKYQSDIAAQAAVVQDTQVSTHKFDVTRTEQLKAGLLDKTKQKVKELAKTYGTAVHQKDLKGGKRGKGRSKETHLLFGPGDKFDREDHIKGESGMIGLTVLKESGAVATLAELAVDDYLSDKYLEKMERADIDKSKPKDYSKCFCFPGFAWPDLSHAQTHKSFMNHIALHHERKKNFPVKKKPSKAIIKELAEIFKPFKNKVSIANDPEKMKDQFIAWVKSEDFTKFAKGSVGWKYSKEAGPNKAAYVGRYVEDNVVKLDPQRFNEVWPRFLSILKMLQDPKSKSTANVEVFVFPKPEPTKIEKIQANMNRLIFNLQAEYNILGSFLFSAMLGTICEKVTPIGADLDHATFTEFFVQTFAEPQYFDIKKSDCGFQKEHIEVILELFEEVYGVSSYQSNLWKAVMGLDERFSVIFHLPDGARYKKNFVGYLFSGMWCTTHANSYLYWMEVREMGYKTAMVMGDDGVIDKKSASVGLLSKVKNLMNADHDLQASFALYGHEYQGGKHFCSRKIVSPNELAVCGPHIPIDYTIEGEKIPDLDVAEFFSQADIYTSLNVNPEKSVMNLVADVSTQEEALISAARNFAAHPESFLKVLAQADPLLAEQQRHNFTFMCAKSLAQRVWEEPRRSAELVEHTE